MLNLPLTDTRWHVGKLCECLQSIEGGALKASTRIFVDERKKIP
jgi:hypothetical protein